MSPAKTFDDSYLTVYFRPYKKFGRQHPALRARRALFFPRFGRPHTLHSAHDHGCVHVDGAPQLPQHILDRLPSRGASRGDPGSRTKALRRGASRVEILVVVVVIIFEVEGGERRRRRWILRELGQVPRRPGGPTRDRRDAQGGWGRRTGHVEDQAPVVPTLDHLTHFPTRTTKDRNRELD